MNAIENKVTLVALAQDCNLLPVSCLFAACRWMSFACGADWFTFICRQEGDHCSCVDEESSCQCWVIEEENLVLDVATVAVLK